MTQAAQRQSSPQDNGHLQPMGTYSTHKTIADPASDNDTGERPVREKLKKTSIASIPKHDVTLVNDEIKVQEDHNMVPEHDEERLQSTNTESDAELRGRPARKRSLDDLEAADQNEASSESVSTKITGRHIRKRSKDVHAGESLKSETRKQESPEAPLHEESEAMDDGKPEHGADLGDPAVIAPNGTNAPPSEAEAADQEMQESILSPRKKRSRERSRDQPEAESYRGQKIAATDETRRRRSSEEERMDQDQSGDGSTKPEEESAQSEHVAQPTESSSKITSEKPSTELPQASGFANFSKEFPFASLARTESPNGKTPTIGTPSSNQQTQTSASAFASSGFAALSGSKSPFGALVSSSSATTPNNSIKSPHESSKSPFTVLPQSKSENAKPSGGIASPMSFASTGPSAFGSSGVSAFGTLGGTAPISGFGSGFGGGNKLSSFAAPTGDTKLGGGASKPFGAATESDEEDKDSDAGSAADKEERDVEKTDTTESRFHKQESNSGEEGETVLFQMRGKLFEFTGHDWSERGLGLFKLNVAKATPEGSGEDQKPKARFIMHQQLTGRVVLNTRIFKEMNFSDGHGKAPSGKLLMFSVVHEGKIVPYMLRLPKDEDVKTLYGEVQKLQKDL